MVPTPPQRDFKIEAEEVPTVGPSTPLDCRISTDLAAFVNSPDSGYMPK